MSDHQETDEMSGGETNSGGVAMPLDAAEIRAEIDRARAANDRV